MVSMLTKIENILGHLKFAIFIILLFALSLSVGTIIESLNGTDYANRLIYKSIPFMLLQFIMFLSIFVATLKRFPIKKRLKGFYVLHLGLILLFSGSFITYKVGIDGQMILLPNEGTRVIEISDDYIQVINETTDSKFVLDLPHAYKKVDLNIDVENFTFKSFLPFSENSLEWSKIDEASLEAMSVQYYLQNSFISQEIVLSLNPKAIDFTSTKQLGPLNVHLIPQEIGACLLQNEIVLWNQNKKECFVPKGQLAQEMGIEIFENKTDSNKRFIVLREAGKLYTFFPDSSPYSYDEQLQVHSVSPWRIFNRNLFETSPQLLLLGDQVAYFDKETKSWHKMSAAKRDWLELPWMGFKLKLLKFSQSQYPQQIPHYQKPIQLNGKVETGQKKAISFVYDNVTYWVTNERPMAITKGNQRWSVHLKKKSVSLPYMINLNKFVLTTNPGDSSPASFESFVTLFTSLGSSEHRIFMNNPLKYKGLTFYQSSYFPLDETQNPNQFGSVLSVNWDPGRFVKYFGALLLVLGTIYHFSINRNRTKVAE